MLIKLVKDTNFNEIEKFIKNIEKKGFEVTKNFNDNIKILIITGNTEKIDTDYIESFDFVESVKRIKEPYKKANRKLHPDDTIIDISGVKIGGGNFLVIAGPCSVESEKQIIRIAKKVKEKGASLLRGGAFKPRTSPYSFQGLGKKAIDYLIKAKKETGLGIVTEIMDKSDLKYFDDIDIIQIGARNMQNFSLLKEVGKTKKPILLKRGLSATYEEWLMAAEYIMREGNENVILCERGIRTFENEIRNNLDISAIPVIKKLSHLPIIIDPSHAAGNYKYVQPLSLAATAAGCDGLIIEVHDNPSCALSDGAQSLTPEKFEETLKKVNKIREAIF
ncbi:MAG: 3-deoxy-7-phosphoheptulonate synthase [Peptoniphilaceae bacterium]|nr:3-deoxy-7-phosphoheptulonate synthase [Peptoniphilaceae bacterium]MDD7383643.1 3-deoxy-7-phosphoheptulonate synthase [Peptoniphilaceae bacterium]MDY3737814.1 3-deoxy-7-phosphoheptulonate synthase [Peptoniphilaceae bacterium]